MGYEKSLLTDDLEHCYICGREALQYHHMIGAHNRKHATEDGLWIPVCLECHIRIHNEHSQRLNYRLKEEAQSAYEQTHSRDDFRRRYGKSYL